MYRRACVGVGENMSSHVYLLCVLCVCTRYKRKVLVGDTQLLQMLDTTSGRVQNLNDLAKLEKLLKLAKNCGIKYVVKNSVL